MIAIMENSNIFLNVIADIGQRHIRPQMQAILTGSSNWDDMSPLLLVGVIVLCLSVGVMLAMVNWS